MGPVIAPAGRHRASGFTLAEIIVVILVIGIASALLLPRLTMSPVASLEREADRLAKSVELAARLAQWRGQTLGVSIGADGYRFWRRDSDAARWQPLAEDSLESRPLPPSATLLGVTRGGTAIPDGAILALRPSGYNDPMIIALGSDGARAEIRSDLLNRVSVTVTAGR